MLIGIPKEMLAEERRVAALPETVTRYVQMGFQVLVEAEAGAGVFQSDANYAAAGAEIAPDARTVYERADLILKVKQPIEHDGLHEAEMIQERATLVCFLHPAAPVNHATVRILEQRHVTALTMDDIPRITRAQTMDALTSMSTVTGYRAVLMAAELLPRFMPMIGTAIGTIQPARVLVVGAGVVGLQAIATAKRLGAAVQAIDVREEARREAGSLKGTRVVGFDVPTELAHGEGGYARSLPREWLEREQQLLASLVGDTDIMILSALVPGEVAPILITQPMVRAMKPGSVIVDVSIDQGGNCDITELGRDMVFQNVHVCGTTNIPGSMAIDATWLYAHNLLHFVENLFSQGPGTMNLEDEIARHALVTVGGRIVHPGTLKAMANA